MKIVTITSFLILYCGLSTYAQLHITPDSNLEKQILETGFIHSPLPLNTENSFETNEMKKNILYSKPLCDKENPDCWVHSGLGNMVYTKDKTISGNGSLKLEFPTNTGKRATGSPSDPDYATYGSSKVTYIIKGENWEKYNRIVFSIYPDCDGARVVNMNLSFVNNNSQSKPGYNSPSGSHLINLKNKQWNHCFLDIAEYQRDKVMSISFDTSLKGKDRTTGDWATYYIDKIELQQIEEPEIVSGWVPGENKIIYSSSGYSINSNKTAILSGNREEKRFQLLNATNNEVVYENNTKQEKTSIGEFNVIDFSSFNNQGVYKLKVGELVTPSFLISERVWDNSLWRVLNFIFCQRCGYAVPGIHSTCHIDLCSKHNGKSISYAGGWHDAGDLSQQTLQTGDVTFSLLEAYNKLKDRNTPLAMRLLEEAEWGLEFMLKNRYGDGYRASSVGLLIWLDGIFSTQDDISTVRVQNLAFDNFLYAGYEAYAAMTINRDPMLQEYLQRIAKEDFDFAIEKYKKDGYGGFLHFYEHSYNTSESQYMATISWSASMLYKLTGEEYYAQLAAEYIRYTLECQRKEPLKDRNKTKGFFYRDKSRQSIVHYNHQSREQVYMQAMTLLCETQPNHSDYNKWVESIQLYGNYLKGLMQYTAPYGMVPSGVYHIEEYKDIKGFNSLHLWPPANANELYIEQVQKGAKLDKEHYVKRFPVWFSIFNGNTAIHLATGKSAAICGNFLKDEELLNVGLEQLYWTVGKNPFGQSLIYGEGHNYPQMDSFSSGEMVGEMPVGIRTLGNDDVPYWPQTNNACYKEVWVTSAGKWLSLIAEY
ncbi:glycoside hydrolase family 9 protein [Bacteroides sp. 519]|uniref:glycoside hydrolase family 9 protein n=1 Tax=Bacteroides sp. 519 TaxID=2302937 RepID=UPI0013D46D7C|nr:glycoside hydrolase family 9 protein [Bacteroides sp. 519]NDV58593.1 glycosyl hydrolase family 9 [Bacteroides sp. 519]